MLRKQTEFRKGAVKHKKLFRRQWKYFRDKRGNVTQTVFRSRSGTKNWMTNVTAAVYDTMDNLITSTDNIGRETHYGYDMSHNPIYVKNPAGYSQSTRYDRYGRVTEERDEMWRKAYHTYSDNGRTHTITFPDGSEKIEKYDSAMRLTEEKVTAQGLSDGYYTTSYEYDNLNRLTKTTYQDETTTENEYLPTKHMQVSSSKDRVGNFSHFTYNKIGQKTSVTNALEHTVQYINDAHGAMEIIGPMDRSNFIINRFSKKINGEEKWFYSSKPKATISPGGKTNAYNYTEWGQLAKHIAPDFYQTHTLYDAFDRTIYTELLEPIFDDDGKPEYPGPPVYSVSNVYDKIGNLIERYEPEGVIKNKYDPLLDRLIETWGPREFDHAIFEYNKVGNRLKASWPEINLFLRYEYDKMNRITTVYKINPDASSVHEQTKGTLMCSYFYDKGGMLKEKTYANGVKTTYTYDHELRLKEMLHSFVKIVTNVSEQQELKFTYKYGTDRQIAAINRSDGHAMSYTYDKIYRLKGEHGSEDNTQYEYDSNGNRITKISERTYKMDYGKDNELLTNKTEEFSGKLNFSGVVTNKYKVDQITLKKNKKDYSAKITADGRPAGGVYFQAQNVPVDEGKNDYSVTVTDTGAGDFKQTAVSQHSFTVTDPENIGKFDGSYNYDIRGQMTNRLENLSKVKYVHDKLGRLTEIHGSDFERYYVYDSMNRRLQSTEIDKNLASPTVVVTNERHFVYDGMNVIAELKIENSKLQIEKCYVRGAGLGGGIGDIISIINCQMKLDVFSSTLSTINYLHYNHRGDVVLTTDETGQEKSKYSYTAFGKLTANSLPLTANYFIGFSTKEYDEKTGLIYFGFRYYDPELGRWLKFDPAKEDGNYYLYAGNNPVMFSDLYGLLKVFMTGFMDDLFLPGKRAADKLGIRAENLYSWTETSRLSLNLREHNLIFPKDPITVYGHSWGGDGAYMSVVKSGVNIRNLVTLDPVSMFPLWSRGKPGNVDNWVNVAQPASFVDNVGDFFPLGTLFSGSIGLGEAFGGLFGSPSLSANGTATLGNQWNLNPGADFNIPYNGSHANAYGMSQCAQSYLK